MTEDFAKRLKRIRKQRQYTQEQLANITGIPLHTIRNYEQELTEEPRSMYLLELAKALDVTPEYLMLGENNMNNYTEAIKKELMQLNKYDDIAMIKNQELNSTVLSHLEMSEDLIVAILTKWNGAGIFKKEKDGGVKESYCTRNYVQEVVLRYCQNRTMFKEKFNIKDGMLM